MIDRRSRYAPASRARKAVRTFAAVRAPLAAVCAPLAALVVWSSGAAAFELRGRVTNMTTREPVVATPVSVVDPRHGMVTQDKLQTDTQGGFVVASLSDEISMYLVQVTYAGVVYTEMVRPATGIVEAQVKVYDTTSSWDSVQVSLPHLMARRAADTLSVDRIFSVVNRTNPPRTILGEGAGFRLFIPENKLRVTAVFATSLGVPIAVEPLATDTPGVFAIEFPFKPGETRVGVSFDVTYGGGKYEYTEPLQYAMDEVVVMTEDPAMEVTSATHALGEPTEVRGFKAYRLASLPRSAALSLAFKGGETLAKTEAESEGAGHEVVTLQEPWQNASAVIMTGFALLLVLVMAFATKSPTAETDEAALLASRRNSLLNRIARLDDLFEMGAVAGELHRAKRRELVDALSRVMYRMERTGPKKTKAARQAKKDDA